MRGKQHGGKPEHSMKRPDVDSGWAWVVLLGGCLGMSLYGLACIGGIFNLIFLDEFGMSKQKTAWLTATQSSLWSLTGPMASVITSRIGVRWTTMLGGLIGAAGFLLTSLVDSYILLWITFSVLVGLGFSLCYVPNIVIMSDYFDEKRNFVYGILGAAIAGGMIILPFIITKTVQFYGWRGAMLITSGLYLQNLVIGAIFRPQTSLPVLVELQEVPNNSIVVDEKITNVDIPSRDNANDNQLANEKTAHLEIDETMSLTADATSDRDASVDVKSIPKKKQPCMAFMRQGDFLVFCFSLFFANAAGFVTYIHFPAYFVRQGASETTIATCLVLLGVFNVIGRVLGGIATNSKDFDVVLMHICSCGITSVSLFLCPVMSGTFGGQLGFSILFGFFGNWFHSMMAPVTIQLLSVEHLTMAFGMENVFAGLGILFGPPAAGWLFDISGSYIYSFYAAGASFLASSVLMMIAPVITQRRKLKQGDTAGDPAKL